MPMGPENKFPFITVCQEPTSKIQGDEQDSPMVKELLIVLQSNQLEYLHFKTKKGARGQCEDYVNTGKGLSEKN